MLRFVTFFALALVVIGCSGESPTDPSISHLDAAAAAAQVQPKQRAVRRAPGVPSSAQSQHLIDGTTVVQFSAIANRDFQPGLEDPNGRPMTVHVQAAASSVAPADTLRFVNVWVVCDNQVWYSTFARNAYWAGASNSIFYGDANGGPKWPVGARIDIFATAVDRNGREYAFASRQQVLQGSA